MTLSLAALADRLKIQTVRWDIQRNDEMSGVGDGRVWQAELADPLWTADVGLDQMDMAEAEQVAAIIRSLYGAQESFLLFAPQRAYPQADPGGALMGASEVVVEAVGEDNRSVALSGLPAGYVLTLGDKGQIAFGPDAARNFFFEFSETAAADDEGETDLIRVFPHLPPGLAEGDAVMLVKPACRGFIMPGSHNPGTVRGMSVTGASFKFMERRR